MLRAKAGSVRIEKGKRVAMPRQEAGALSRGCAMRSVW